jgi:hypothetical protein
MNRLLHIFIAVCILASQSAWAFHDIELDNHPEHFQSQQIEHHDEDASAHNHCGHASAHIVGLFYNTKIVQCIALPTKIAMVKDFTSSMSYQPPTPPPNS